MEASEVKLAASGEKRNLTTKILKKSKSGKNIKKPTNIDLPEIFRRVGFTASRNGPDVYLKAMEKLELYAFTKYKLGTKDVWKYLQQHKIILFIPPELVLHLHKLVRLPIHHLLLFLLLCGAGHSNSLKPIW